MSSVSLVIGIMGVCVGITSISLAIYFGSKQRKAEKVMATFIKTVSNQSQSVTNSLKDMTDDKKPSLDLIKGKAESAYKNMAALNGTLKKFYEDYYKIKLDQKGS
ncbi:hypothetical protein ACFLT9_00555 [Acidobacteriota bacterium]